LQENHRGARRGDADDPEASSASEEAEDEGDDALSGEHYSISHSRGLHVAAADATATQASKWAAAVAAAVALYES
jgi:hypothetical protein